MTRNTSDSFIYYPALFLFSLLSSLLIGVLAASTPSSSSLPRGNSIAITSSNPNPTNASYFDGQVVGLAFTLPWWTSLIGGILDLLIGFWGATLGWDAETQPGSFIR